MNLDRLKWHHIYIGCVPVYVLTYGQRWLAMLYYNWGYSIRVWDLPSWEFKDYNETDVPSLEVPPGFKEGLDWHLGISQHLYWLLSHLGLPERFRLLPISLTPLSEVPFVSKGYVCLNGCRLSLATIRRSLPPVLHKPMSDHIRSIRYNLNRPRAMTWEQRYPRVKDELQSRLSSKAADFKGVCGQRVALKSGKAGLRAFNKLRDGSLMVEWEETVFTNRGEEIFLFGFNHE